MTTCDYGKFNDKARELIHTLYETYANRRRKQMDIGHTYGLVLVASLGSRNAIKDQVTGLNPQPAQTLGQRRGGTSPSQNPSPNYSRPEVSGLSTLVSIIGRGKTVEGRSPDDSADTLHRDIAQGRSLGKENQQDFARQTKRKPHGTFTPMS
ncbi:hypothetical protein M8J76_007747 [Diaphorina citri]|nr:hypothetical protein M8J76_007747 [Diaphorina citri]